MSSHSYRGNAPLRSRRSAGFSQASTRRHTHLYDQHGRQYSTELSNKSGMPTAMVVADFQAPWMPDQQYLHVNPDNTSELWIDYDTLLHEREHGQEDYHRSAVDYARENKLPLPERGTYPPAITDRVGVPPKPVEPIVAAIQGNQWILGFTDVVDQRLAQFVTPVAETDAILRRYDFSDAAPEARRGMAPWERVAAQAALSAPRTASPIDPAADDVVADDLEEEAFSALDGAGSENEVLGALDDEIDAEAMGGKTVDPRNADRVARQAPRRPGASAVRAKQGANRSHTPRGRPSPTKMQRDHQRGGRKTLADGAAPVVSD